ncbi:hypothetical protein HYQ46_008420 [Verticillium longisporum]|nr:hypothetical protein HYQ46_008420 [Verticillium longisporum]
MPRRSSCVLVVVETTCQRREGGEEAARPASQVHGGYLAPTTPCHQAIPLGSRGDEPDLSAGSPRRRSLEDSTTQSG